MTELLLLDNTKVFSLFDTGSTVNLLSESVIKSSEYLSSLEHRKRNTSGEMLAVKFIELCFRQNDDYILHTTALVIHDFDSVQFLLSIYSMNQLNSVIDVNSRQILIRKKSFVFKTCFHSRIKAHDTFDNRCQMYVAQSFEKWGFHIKAISSLYQLCTVEFCIKIQKREMFFENFKFHGKMFNYKSRHCSGKPFF